MVNIYTDGATSHIGRENAIGGYAFVVEENGEELYSTYGKIYPATNNICELTALIEACEYIDKNLHGQQVTVYSDSAYCINCYKEKWYENWKRNGWKTSSKKPVANQELWKKLIPYFYDSKIKFEKCDGHSGNQWNDYADHLAVKARGGKW